MNSKFVIDNLGTLIAEELNFWHTDLSLDDYKNITTQVFQENKNEKFASELEEIEKFIDLYYIVKNITSKLDDKMDDLKKQKLKEKKKPKKVVKPKKNIS